MALTKSIRKTSASETTETSSTSGTSRATGRVVSEWGGTAPMPQFGSLSVRPDSLTPYTDATNCRHSKRKSAATGSGGRSSSGGGVRRPMNAFMVWSQLERRQISAADPTLHNAEISRRLGARWRRLATAERRPYMDEADRLRVMHAIEFPGYKYTPRKSRRTMTRTPVSSRRQASQRSIASRRSTVGDFAQLPAADAFDSEVSRYFAKSNGGASAATASSSRRSSKRRRAVGRHRTATESSSGGESSGRNLPPTPDSSTHCLVDQGPVFRVIDRADTPRRVAAPSKRARRTTATSASRRFEFPAVAFPSDVQLGGIWNSPGAASDDDEVGALDTPISLEQDALAGCSLFNLDDHRGDVGPTLSGIGDVTTGWNDVGGPFYVDYCTPEVAAIVRDDWLEETIHALI